MGSCQSLSKNETKVSIVNRASRIQNPTNNRSQRQSCLHEEVVQKIIAENQHKDDASSLRREIERWTVCSFCNMMFLITNDGYSDSAPVLENPLKSSSLATRRKREFEIHPVKQESQHFSR